MLHLRFEFPRVRKQPIPLQGKRRMLRTMQHEVRSTNKNQSGNQKIKQKAGQPAHGWEHENIYKSEADRTKQVEEAKHPQAGRFRVSYSDCWDSCNRLCSFPEFGRVKPNTVSTVGRLDFYSILLQLSAVRVRKTP